MLDWELLKSFYTITEIIYSQLILSELSKYLYISCNIWYNNNMLSWSDALCNRLVIII